MNQMPNDFPQTVASDEPAANYLPAVDCLRPNPWERVNDGLIINEVKMIVWDLDETFWKGTLTEGGITFVDSHAQMVRTLAGRGIISSISSKNDHRAARDLLERNGIWDYFVFPSISWSPKGRTIAEIVENAALRAENVLFIDDNIFNLEEVRFFNPGIMLAQPSEILDGLLDHPHLAGKADPHLKRLQQYQVLQTKFLARQAYDLSNEEFLRSSGIRLVSTSMSIELLIALST
jgi:FkbH-like protein